MALSNQHEFVQAAKDLVSSGETRKAIELLVEKLEAIDAVLYSQAMLFLNQYRKVESDHKLNLIRYETYSLESNKITNAIIYFIQQIPEKSQQGSGKIKKKGGKLLHDIPRKMPLQMETKCVVRIAPTEELLLEGFTKTEHTEIEDVQTSQIMEVELVDFSSDKSFEIRNFSSTEQFTEQDDFTQWIFFVKPLKEGNHTLYLKISVVQVIEGRERKKEVVLEKAVNVSTLADTQKDTPGEAKQWEDTHVTIEGEKRQSGPAAAAAGAAGVAKGNSGSDEVLHQEMAPSGKLADKNFDGGSSNPQILGQGKGGSSKPSVGGHGRRGGEHGSGKRGRRVALRRFTAMAATLALLLMAYVGMNNLQYFGKTNKTPVDDNKGNLPIDDPNGTITIDDESVLIINESPSGETEERQEMFANLEPVEKLPVNKLRPLEDASPEIIFTPPPFMPPKKRYSPEMDPEEIKRIEKEEKRKEKERKKMEKEANEANEMTDTDSEVPDSLTEKGIGDPKKTKKKERPRVKVYYTMADEVFKTDTLADKNNKVHVTVKPQGFFTTTFEFFDLEQNKIKAHKKGQEYILSFEAEDLTRSIIIKASDTGWSTTRDFDGRYNYDWEIMRKQIKIKT